MPKPASVAARLGVVVLVHALPALACAQHQVALAWSLAVPVARA